MKSRITKKHEIHDFLERSKHRGVKKGWLMPIELTFGSILPGF